MTVMLQYRGAALRIGLGWPFVALLAVVLLSVPMV